MTKKINENDIQIEFEGVRWKFHCNICKKGVMHSQLHRGDQRPLCNGKEVVVCQKCVDSGIVPAVIPSPIRRVKSITIEEVEK